jgi:hypothetical protein
MPFKDFAAGEILTAADVDDYLMRQTVMVFDDASARDTALSAVLTEGMKAYLKDVDETYVYTGAGWELDAPSFIRDYPQQTEILAAEDSGRVLMTTGGSAVPVWNHGSHNYIINGAFDIWQRGTSITTASNQPYGADRWLVGRLPSGNATMTQETFGVGDIEAVGFGDAQFFARTEFTSGTASGADQLLTSRIEDVRTLAGSTATLSFWARVGSGTESITPNLVQRFGSGGSSAVVANASGVTVTTTWQRFSGVISIPSISGKTIGSGNYLELRFQSANFTTGNTLDIWGVQLEAGSVATPFKRHAPSLQGELAACQRYYYRLSPNATTAPMGLGWNTNTTVARVYYQFPVTMRDKPTGVEQSGTASDYQVNTLTTAIACSSVPTHLGATTDSAYMSFTVASGLTAGNGALIRSATTNAYLGWSAEL